MRRFAWTRILSVLLVLCMVASVVSMGVPAALAERVELDSSTTVEYFPVTLFDYDEEAINNATHQADVDAGLGDVWKGLYFSQGSPGNASFTYVTEAGAHTDLTWAQVKSGTYYSDEDCTTKVTVEAIIEGGGAEYMPVQVTESNYSSFDFNAGEYYYKYSSYDYNSGSYFEEYLRIERIEASDYGEYVAFDVYVENDSLPHYEFDEFDVYTKGTVTGYKLMAGSTPLATLSGTDTSAKVGVTLYTAAGTQTTGSMKFADWNYWDKNDNDTASGNLLGQGIYSGLVASRLDANKNIVFNVPDAGLFTLDPVAGKTVYTNVQVPFLYNADKNIYEFDSDTHGVYFANNTAQGTSSTPASNSKLYFNKNNKQTYSGMAGKYGDGSTNLWAPFNSVQTISSEDAVEYHFGMNATVPFTMTSDGKMTNSTKDDIEFSFSGDDDVWIFVDGILVADLGGIHNRLNVTINFATNKVTYFVSDSNTATYNNAKAPIVDGNGYSDSTNTTGNLFAGMTQVDVEGSNGQKGYETNLFNETVDGTTTTGLLGTDRVSFAAKDNHELTIYYMERGGGSSNSKIWFNLPVKDTVSVKKVVDEQMVVNADGTTSRQELSAEYQEVVNNLNFEFTMMKNGAPLANTTYNLLNANGQVIANPSTDANGKFTLKNGQTAKFTSEFTNETSGDTYQVYETIKDGFIYTEYSATKSQSTTLVSGTLTTDAHTYYSKIAGENESSDDLYTVTNKTYNGGAEGMLYSTAYTVYGTGDTEDSLSFVCENLLNASLPTPSAIPNDDKFVLDFGLSAELEIFSNDLYIGENPTISIDTSGLKYGTATYNAATKTVTYTPTAQMTGVEVIPYTLTVSAVGADDASGTAYIYIIPATSMYYEENFGTLVTFTDGTSGGWTQDGTPQTDKQEPGKVGTPGDSPYGSDQAYLNDSGDSNGSSMHVDTTNGAAQFVYTFTGTGTSFFAHTSNNTAYLRIRIYDVATDEAVYASYLDTVYKTSDTLYNIPVFTWNAVDAGLDYGEYKVEVTVAKKTTTQDKEGNTVTLYHSDFWLDGIRVFEPLNPEDENYDEAETAYNRDAEANMTVVTLRDKILSDADIDDNNNPVWAEGDNFVLFTDVNGAMQTAEEYKSIGPKEEVYLMTEQTVSFSLVNWDPNTYHIYLGIKAPTGNGTVEIGSTQLTINNAADCYYDISAYGTITEETIDGETVKVVTFDITSVNGLISLTNIKVTGDVQFIVIPGTDVNIGGSSGQNP